MPKYKILISCHACSPYRGSEPGMGWNFVKTISQKHEVHVIVEQVKWQGDINRYLKENPGEGKNMKFYYIPKKRRPKLREIWPPSYYYFYRQWQKKAYRLAVDLINKEEIDIVHQLNMVGFREPGYLWKIDLPFVWGPIGGMMNTPWIFFSELNLYGKFFYGGRNLINSIHRIFLIRPRKAASHKKSVLIAATPDDQRCIKKYWHRNALLMAEVGHEEQINKYISHRKPDDVLNIIWSGQHTSGKALNILLRSLSFLPSKVNWKLRILGSGDMTSDWKKLAEDLKIDDRCKWLNWLPKKEAINKMAQSHLFCITSLKDLTSTVTLEALSQGLPIICLDHLGFSYVVDESCGIKIPVVTPKETYKYFADAISSLYSDEILRQKLARGALKRAKDFSWEKKAVELNNIYKSLLE